MATWSGLTAFSCGKNKLLYPGAAFSTIQDWMAWKWNNSSKATGPLVFFGIHDSGNYDAAGMKIYGIGKEAHDLAHTLGFFQSNKKLIEGCINFLVHK